MTTDQTRLISHWTFTIVIVIMLVLIFDHEYFRWFALIGMVVLGGLEKSIRPLRPNGIPTPLKIIESSRPWKVYFAVFALAAVVVAVISATNAGVGNWLKNNFWILLVSIAALLVGPLVQSEFAFFNALGEDD
jgi:hypothetical protein